MFWTTFSSPLTKLGKKPSANVKIEANPLRPHSPRFLVFSLLPIVLYIGFLVFSSAGANAARPPRPEQPLPGVSIAPAGVFGSLEIQTNSAAGMEEWQRFQKAVESERSAYAACDRGSPACPAHLSAWRGQIKTWSQLSGLAQIEAVNAWINRRIRYVDDARLFGVADRWATVAQSMKGSGDCEDYALAKYQSLLELGIPQDRLRLVIVKDTRKKIGHAVLTVKTGAGTYVLDNQNRRVLADKAISYYAPVYSVNASGRWINIATRTIKTRIADAIEPAVMKPTITGGKPEISRPLQLDLRPTLTAFEMPAAQ